MKWTHFEVPAKSTSCSHSCLSKLMLPITLPKHQATHHLFNPKDAAALALLKDVMDASYLKHPGLKVKK